MQNWVARLLGSLARESGSRGVTHTQWPRPGGHCSGQVALLVRTYVLPATLWSCGVGIGSEHAMHRLRRVVAHAAPTALPLAAPGAASAAAEEELERDHEFFVREGYLRLPDLVTGSVLSARVLLSPRPLPQRARTGSTASSATAGELGSLRIRARRLGGQPARRGMRLAISTLHGFWRSMKSSSRSSNSRGW